jgi:hypothetical protein
MSEEQQCARDSTAFTFRTARMDSQSAIAVVVKNKTVTVMQSGLELRFGWLPGSRLLMQTYSSVEQDVVPFETAAFRRAAWKLANDVAREMGWIV